MYTVPQTSLTLPAVVGRRLNEGLGLTAGDATALFSLHAARSGAGALRAREVLPGGHGVSSGNASFSA
jgi:hypothetical protein